MKEESENIEQRLEHLKNGNSFRVPDNYFEDFAGRLRTRIEEESKSSRKLSWFVYLKPALAIAAVLAIVLLLVVKVPVNLSQDDYKLFSNNKNTIKTETTSSLSEELTASFESLVQLPQSQFLSTLEEDFNQGDKSQIDPKALEDYLADNSFDYEIIGNN
jgi:hypothetical protein